MKSPFENKKSHIKLVITFDEIIFPERFPHSDKCLWGISYEYLSGWPEPTKEESLGNVCVILSSKIFIVVCITDKGTVSIPACYG